jgi:very-short-patch-repair endonuclease
LQPYSRMANKRLQPESAELWALVRRQHGVVTRAQLLAHGLSGASIQRRMAAGRLHPLRRGVYAVGRPEVSCRGRWMAAVLCCGPRALLSHSSAGSLWGVLAWDGSIDIVLPHGVFRRHPGIRLHRRLGLGVEHCRRVDGIPVTDPVSTLVDIAACRSRDTLGLAIREADRLDLIDPVSLRASLDSVPRRPGIGALRSLLDSETFSLTDSELERRFLRLIRSAGLPAPKTQAWVNGFRVDFHWPELGLVVETDGLRYHRTAGQQKRDLARDQAHVSTGLTTLRFTAAQVRYEAERTVQTLRSVIARLSAG